MKCALGAWMNLIKRCREGSALNDGWRYLESLHRAKETGDILRREPGFGLSKFMMRITTSVVDLHRVGDKSVAIVAELFAAFEIEWRMSENNPDDFNRTDIEHVEEN